MMADDDLAELGHNTPAAVHLMVEAKNRAFALRDAFLGDPDFVEPFPTELLTAAVGRQQRALIL